MKATSGASEQRADEASRRRRARPRGRAAQRVLDPGAGMQRDGPLERAPALEHGDLHRSPRAGRGAGGMEGRRPARRRPRMPSGPDDLVAAGDRLVEVHLLGDDRADPADALEDLVLGRPEKLSRIEPLPRPSTNAASPGTKATFSRSAFASRSVVSM